MEDRNILFKCLNCRNNFQTPIGDFVRLKCPKCGNQPTDNCLKTFRSAVTHMFTLENDKEGFGFDFQFPSESIY